MKLIAETERVKFRAVNHGEHSAVTRPYRYAVALVDTQTHKAQVFDTDLFVCSRIVKGLEAEAVAGIEASEEESVKPVAASDATNEYYKSRLLLGESFGTKKTKQILGSLDRNRIDMNQLAAQSGFITKSLDSSIHKIAEDSEKEVEMTSSTEPSISASLLPPHNAKTKRVEEIYKMQDLIPSEVYYSLEVGAIVRALQKKDSTLLEEAMAPYALHEVVEGRIKSLAAIATTPSAKALTHTVRCLVYLNHLLAFRTLNETKINGDLAVHLPMATGDLVASFLQQFAEAVTVGNGYQRYKLSSVCRDRLVLHICVLILILDGYRTNAARLSVALKISAAKAVDYLKAVGCTIEKPVGNEPSKFVVPDTGREVAVKMGVLKAPLTIVAKKSQGPPTRRK